MRSVVDAPFSHGTLTVASDSPQVFSDSDIAVLEELTGALSEGFRRLDDLQQLAAERQRLAVTLRSIGESVVATDGDGRIVLINRIAESLTGWTSREAEGRPLSDVLQVLEQSTRQPVDSLVQRVLATGTALELVPNGILVSRNGAERLNLHEQCPDPGRRGQNDRCCPRIERCWRSAKEGRRAAEVREAGVARRPGRGYRPRLQQHPHNHYRLPVPRQNGYRSGR